MKEVKHTESHVYFLCYLLHQVLTAIYPAPTVALATGVVSMTTMPPAVAAPAQDIMNPSSPLATGVQGSAVAPSQPNVAVELEPKVEVKRESQLDCQAEDVGYGWSSCAVTTAGKPPLVLSDLVLNATLVSCCCVGHSAKMFSLVECGA